MSERYTRPRWGGLYLVLPLAGGLFWLTGRVHASNAGRGALQLVVIAIIFAYVEIWQRLNRVALLRHPRWGDGKALYRAREAVAAHRPAPVTAAFYSDLFLGPVSVSPWQPAETPTEATSRAADHER